MADSTKAPKGLLISGIVVLLLGLGGCVGGGALAAGPALDFFDSISKVEVWHAGCSHYYLSPSGRIVTQYPYSMFTYRDSVAEPDLDEFELGRH